jgi:hypothetical protein
MLGLLRRPAPTDDLGSIDCDRGDGSSRATCVSAGESVGATPKNCATASHELLNLEGSAFGFDTGSSTALGKDSSGDSTDGLDVLLLASCFLMGFNEGVPSRFAIPFQ